MNGWMGWDGMGWDGMGWIHVNVQWQLLLEFTKLENKQKI